MPPRNNNSRCIQMTVSSRGSLNQRNHQIDPLETSSTLRGIPRLVVQMTQGQGVMSRMETISDMRTIKVIRATKKAIHSWTRERSKDSCSTCEDMNLLWVMLELFQVLHLQIGGRIRFCIQHSIVACAQEHKKDKAVENSRWITNTTSIMICQLVLCAWQMILCRKSQVTNS